MEEILVTEDGYNQFMELLNSIEKKISDTDTDSTEACEAATGDGWHDNFSFEALVEDSRKLNYQLKKMYNDKTKLRIISDKYVERVININDTATIKFIYDNDYDIDEITLTGLYIPNDNQTSLNSPLGKAIYKQKISSILEYKVNNNIIKIEILDIKNTQ